MTALGSMERHEIETIITHTFDDVNLAGRGPVRTWDQQHNSQRHGHVRGGPLRALAHPDLLAAALCSPADQNAGHAPHACPGTCARSMIHRPVVYVALDWMRMAGLPP